MMQQQEKLHDRQKQPRWSVIAMFTLYYTLTLNGVFYFFLWRQQFPEGLILSLELLLCVIIMSISKRKSFVKKV